MDTNQPKATIQECDMPHNPTSTPRKQRRAIWGWALYDWANSAFATTVMAVFFPILYKQYWSAGIDVNLSTFRLGMGNAAASLLVALMAPIIGAISDQSGRRKRLLIWFTYLGVLVTAALALVPQGHWFWPLALFSLGIIGFQGAEIFYDSLLPQLAPAHRIDRISALGYALGYLGGGLLLALNVLMTLKPHLFGLADATQAVRAAFVTVALWWGLFALATFLLIPPDPVVQRPALWIQINAGWRKFLSTLKKVRQLKTLFTFLLAYWCYIDGVHTIIKMAVDYGISLGFNTNDLIVALLITQFIGFPSALLFGRLGTHWGARRSIYLALAVYMGVTLWGAFMTSAAEFYVLAAVIGLVQGGIQALSRSYYARFIPLAGSAEFYGFYNMLGKFAAIIGPALMGITGLLVKRAALAPASTPEQIHATGLLATRLSIISVLILFAAGALLLYFVNESRGKAELEAIHKPDSAPPR
jgi:UMF1 family MFS transporter